MTSHEERTRIKKHDFRSPKKFGKDQLRTIESLHESFAKSVTSYLSTSTRTDCEVLVHHVDIQRYGQYINGLDEREITVNFEIAPLEKSLNEITISAHFKPVIGFFLVDKYLGGKGHDVFMDREFTEIEMAIFEHFINKLTPTMEESWIKYLDVIIHRKNIEPNPKYAQVFLSEDVVVVVDFQVKLNDVISGFSLCFPSIELELMMDKFTSKNTRPLKRMDSAKESEYKQALLTSIKNVDVEMNVVLDEVELNLHDILQLEVNDIIPLSKELTSPITVMVDQTPWFEAVMGETKHRKAVKISKLIEKEPR
ncbi:MAG: FliM/FliN family flagellar motor switch protein [Erysipelothrix sp.]|nr:FliM/FliN family flagellar motor switch protein [Erysipelothrix sp.]